MNPALLFILIVSSLTAFAAEKKYTEEEFIKKVNEEVKKKVDDVKKKSVSDLTKELLDKEEKLKLRELELQKHMDALKVSQSDLARKYAEFEAKQKSFIGCIERNDQESKQRVSQLVELIENMKPEKAAEVLTVQEPDLAVKILQLTDAKRASKIFNFMDKEVSAKLQKQYIYMKK